MSMNWKQIGACGLAGAIGGYAVAGALRAESLSALFINSDVVGSALGVALTVATTLWIEGRRRARQRAEEMQLLKDALSRFRVALDLIDQGFPDDAPFQIKSFGTTSQYELLREAKASLEFARASVPLRDINVWSALQSFNSAYSGVESDLTKEERILNGRNVTANVLDISRAIILAASQELRAPLNTALQAVHGQ